MSKSSKTFLLPSFPDQKHHLVADDFNWRFQMAIEVNATPRGVRGRGASRRLRHTGRVPGILYGADKPAQNIELDHNQLAQHLKHESFHASILTLSMNGDKQQVLLRDLQMHPWRAQVLHIDFQRVARDRKIHMKVPLHFKNAEIAPGVKTGGGTVNHVMSELDIICLPDDLPEFIEIDLSNLQLGHSIHLSELTLPKGVESVQLRSGDDAVVATIVVPRIEVEPEVEAAAAEAAAVAAATAAAPAAGTEKAEPEKKKEGDKK
jgi:large subunit ribosomal protein L25